MQYVSAQFSANQSAIQDFWTQWSYSAKAPWLSVPKEMEIL